MKSIHILILWLFFQPVFPQKTTDQFLFRASYTFSYKTDPLQKDFVETDLIYLDIGNIIAVIRKSGIQIKSQD